MNPYQPYPDGKVQESYKPLISDHDAEEIAKSFHQHPAFNAGLSNLSIVKQNQHYEHYVQHFWELNNELINVRPGGDVSWIEQIRQGKNRRTVASTIVMMAVNI